MVRLWPFGRHAELRSVVETREIDALPWDVGGSIGSGGSVSTTRALSLAPVFACVRLIATQTASLPLRQYRITGIDTLAHMSMGSLFTSPSVVGTRFDWIHRAVTSLALRGNAYGIILTRDRMQYPTTIEWAHPDDIICLDRAPSGPGSFTHPLWYWQGRLVPAEDMVHIPLFTIPFRVQGLSPIEACMATVATGLSAQDYTADWFINGAVPPGVFKNVAKTVQQKEAEEIKNRLSASIRTRKPMVHGNDWEYTPIAVSSNEAKFIETQKLTATNIANIYGIPPSMVGGDAGGSGLSYQNTTTDPLNFIKYALRSWLEAMEEAFGKLLPRNQVVKFDLDAFLRADLAARMSAYQIARTIGIMSVNEIRAKEDLPPIDGGDEYTPLGEAAQIHLMDAQAESQAAIAAQADVAPVDPGASDATVSPDGAPLDSEPRQARYDALIAAERASAMEVLEDELVVSTPMRGAEAVLELQARAAGVDTTPGHDELHHYWTKGAGLAKWADSPKPWTTLVAHLTKYVGLAKAKVYASRWFIEVFGYAAGSDKNRVAHGHPPRGKKVGPG